MSQDSWPVSLRTLPSYKGEYETKSAAMTVRTHRQDPKEVLDTQGLTTILSTPIMYTITLAELLRIRPNVWNEVGDCLEKFGVKNP